jgi:hypothetical protein
MFCLRKTGNFKGRLQVNRLTLKKTKSFQYQKFSWVHVAKIVCWCIIWFPRYDAECPCLFKKSYLNNNEDETTKKSNLIWICRISTRSIIFFMCLLYFPKSIWTWFIAHTNATIFEEISIFSVFSLLIYILADCVGSYLVGQ